MSYREQEARLISIAIESTWLHSALVAVRSLGLPSWCIGAGAIRNLVWDSLHGYASPSRLPDIDVAYFDAAGVFDEREIQRRLTTSHPGMPWEVTNQATVHEWFAAEFGETVAPLASLEDGVATWPEFATAVGLTLRNDDSIGVIAPHGLDDLFGMIVRRNPARASVETYRQRVADKQFQQRWPLVTVVDS